MEPLVDQDIGKALEWFLSFLNEGEWKERKNNIEDHLDNVLATRSSQPSDGDMQPVAAYHDRIGWYLYLAEMALTDPLRYEPTQGARILPVIKQIGAELESLQSVENVDDRVQRMLYSQNDDADSSLFELLVATRWKSNGFELVNFVPESPTHKTPDLSIAGDDQEWAVECKRLSRSSQYSEQERTKWLRMWRRLSRFLAESALPVILDIQFHVELEELPDDFLVAELATKLPLVVMPTNLISNEVWDVSVEFVDFAAAKDHLSRYLVKYPSDQLNLLIAGRREPNRGFACVVGGKFAQARTGRGNNRYLDDLGFAAGAFWDCDAPAAIETKARDIRHHLSRATEQLPLDIPSVVHIGIETLDGQIVEAERYRRITDTVFGFDFRDKDLRWVYCHLFQSYAPPEQCWVIDETVYFFGSSSTGGKQPLSHSMLVVPEHNSEKNGVHWKKPPA